MPLAEKLLAVLLFLATVGFLVVFRSLPNGSRFSRVGMSDESSPDLARGDDSPDSLYRLLERYGAEGTRAFRRFLRIDLFFPPVYGALFFVLSDLLATTDPIVSAAGGVSRAATVVTVCFDYAENALLLHVIRNLPRKEWLAAKLAGVSTRLKFAGLAVAATALIVEGIARAIECPAS